MVISLLIGFHNYSIQQGWKLSDSPFIFALRVSLVKDLYVMVGSKGWKYRSNTSQLHRIVWSHKILVKKDGLTLMIDRFCVIFLNSFAICRIRSLGQKNGKCDSGRHERIAWKHGFPSKFCIRFCFIGFLMKFWFRKMV